MSRSPSKTAHQFGIEEIIDPRDTRPLLCEVSRILCIPISLQSVLTITLQPVSGFLMYIRTYCPSFPRLSKAYTVLDARPSAVPGLQTVTIQM